MDLRSPCRPLSVRDRALLVLWIGSSLFVAGAFGWGWLIARDRAVDALRQQEEDRKAVEELDRQIRALKERARILENPDNAWMDGLAEVSHLLPAGTALHAYRADAQGQQLVLRTAGEKPAEEALAEARWKPLTRGEGAEVTLWKTERDGR